jgi:DNA-binding Lrp family transcriptional regulator
MKDISQKLVGLLGAGYCTPQIAKIAKRLKEPGATIHYNVKKLEREGQVRGYKAVFDYKKIERGFCVFCLLNLSPDEYGEPERIAGELSKFDEIESVDIITGDWELIVKIRARDQEEYFGFVKRVLSRKGITKIKTLTSLRQMKSEFTQS